MHRTILRAKALPFGGVLGAQAQSGMVSEKEEIAAAAARMVVEEGLEYGPAKRRAARQLGLPPRALPDNVLLERAVEEYIAVFCADEQAHELLVLRRLALQWMERLARFRPHLTGAVWRGTATRRSDIYLQLFCEDSKSTELQLIDDGIHFEARQVPGFQGEPVDALSVHIRSAELGESLGVHLMVHDLDDLRGALKPDGAGRSQRGDAAALRKLMEEVDHG